MTEPARPASLLRAMFEVARAAVALIAADIAIRTRPFRAIVQRIESPLERAASRDAQDVAIRRITWAIAAAHRRLPWNVACLATAFAANRLLARRGVGSELWLGVRANEQPNDESPMLAHAWLEADGHVVTGASEKSRFAPLRALVTHAAAHHSDSSASSPSSPGT